jgi:hypothetical protein
VHKITDLNVRGLNSSKHAALMGDANEMIVAGLITRWGFDVGMLNAKGGAYDVWVMAYDSPECKNLKPLRVQVKTVSSGGSIKLGAGSRGGVDREYVSGVKEYKYTTEHNDLVIGVVSDTLDLYLVPTCMTANWGGSKSINHLEPLKNNYEILLNWNPVYMIHLLEELAQDKRNRVDEELSKSVLATFGLPYVKAQTSLGS